MQQNVLNSMLAATEAQVAHQADRTPEDVLRAAGQERLLAQVASVQGSLDVKRGPVAPTTAPRIDHPLVVFRRQLGTRKAVATMAYMLASCLTAHLSPTQLLLEALKTVSTPEAKKIVLRVPLEGILKALFWFTVGT
jgi:hypothetical protein